MAGSVIPINPAIVAEVAIGFRRLSFVFKAIANVAPVWAKMVQNSMPLIGSNPLFMILLIRIGINAQCSPKMMMVCQNPASRRPAMSGLNP